jgi:hypothetical protein
MAEYKGRRERKRARGGAAGEGHDGPPHGHMIILIGLGAKKPKKKGGGSVEGKAARKHLGKRARGAPPKRADGGSTDDNWNGFMAEQARQNALDGDKNPTPWSHEDRAPGVGGYDQETISTTDPKTGKVTTRNQGPRRPMQMEPISRENFQNRARGGGYAKRASGGQTGDNMDSPSGERDLGNGMGRFEGTMRPMQEMREAPPPPDEKVQVRHEASGGRLTAAERHKMPSSEFALPGRGEGHGGKGVGSYPIPDASHGRNALARVAQHGSPDQQKRVRAAVHRKFPNIGQE